MDAPYTVCDFFTWYMLCLRIHQLQLIEAFRYFFWNQPKYHSMKENYKSKTMMRLPSAPKSRISIAYHDNDQVVVLRVMLRRRRVGRLASMVLGARRKSIHCRRTFRFAATRRPRSPKRRSLLRLQTNEYIVLRSSGRYVQIPISMLITISNTTGARTTLTQKRYSTHILVLIFTFSNSKDFLQST